ncbi:TPA: hypothetical protein ACH3X3_001241 [Trebouxia sp. C0006]
MQRVSTYLTICMAYCIMQLGEAKLVDWFTNRSSSEVSQGPEEATSAQSNFMYSHVQPWKSGIAVSLQEAEARLKATDDKPDQRQLKMAMLLLSSDAQQLCCSLKNFSGHVSRWTPTDVFVFSPENRLQAAFEESGCHLGEFAPTLIFLRIHEHWETPEEAEDSSTWTATDTAGENYRRMGHWRLAFQMEFALKLGYKYVLQTDDDSGFAEPIDTNLIKFLGANQVYMAARNIILEDPQDCTLGLAEIAKLFLVTERLVPTTLYSQSCEPSNISGLYTTELGGPATGGYRTNYLYGNFVIISLDFWFQDQIQRFVRLVLRTGAHFRYRWNEQQVQTLVWKIFVPANNFHLFDFAYEHPLKNWHGC